MNSIYMLKFLNAIYIQVNKYTKLRNSLKCNPEGYERRQDRLRREGKEKKDREHAIGSSQCALLFLKKLLFFLRDRHLLSTRGKGWHWFQMLLFQALLHFQLVLVSLKSKEPILNCNRSYSCIEESIQSNVRWFYSYATGFVRKLQD